MNTQNILNAEIVASRISETNVRPEAAQKRINKLAFNGVTVEMAAPDSIITVKSERINRTDSFTLDQLMLKALLSATALFNDLDSDVVFSLEKPESKVSKAPARTKQVAIALSPADKLARLHYDAVEARLVAAIADAHADHAAMIATLNRYTTEELAALETPAITETVNHYDFDTAAAIRDELRYATKKQHVAAFIEQAKLTIDTSKGADAVQFIRTDKGASIIVELVGKYAPTELTDALASYKMTHDDAWSSCKLSFDKDLVKLMGKAPVVLIFSL